MKFSGITETGENFQEVEFLKSGFETGWASGKIDAVEASDKQCVLWLKYRNAWGMFDWEINLKLLVLVSMILSYTFRKTSSKESLKGFNICIYTHIYIHVYKHTSIYYICILRGHFFCLFLPFSLAYILLDVTYNSS